MTDSNKPDLEDSINVRESHRDVDRSMAATSREHGYVDNGKEPISSMVVVALSAIALIGGGVLFKDQLFNYGDHPVGYKRSDDPAGGMKGPPLGAAADVYAKKGAALYSANCASCHGGQGNGVSAPPLVKSDWVTNSAHFVGIVMNGVKGDIEVNGKTYNMGAMPNIGASMSDFELASLATYLRSTFGNETLSEPIVVSIPQIKEIRNNLKKRGNGVTTAKEMLTTAPFKKAIQAKPLTADAIVDKTTGEPQ